MAANGRNHTVLLGHWASFRFAGRAACARAWGVLGRRKRNPVFRLPQCLGGRVCLCLPMPGTAMPPMQRQPENYPAYREL